MTQSAFAVRMAWRQTRTAWRHFLAFLTCVAVGVAALVAVGSLGRNLDRTLAREAKALMGGDIELRSPRPLDPETQAALEGLRRQGTTVLTVRELVGMARDPRSGRTQLVELKAVADGYPLYGRLDFELFLKDGFKSPITSTDVTSRSAAPDTLSGQGALVHQDLLGRLGLAVGDPLTIGAATFTIRGVVRQEPDRPAGFVTVGPRVLIHARDLDDTGLVQLGSRVRHRTLLRLPPGTAADATRETLARRVMDPTVRVAAFEDAQPGLRRFFTQLTTYLGLVGLVSLLVGGIGVASSVRTFVRRQLATIAILKCLGAGSRVLLFIYLLQIQALGIFGSLLGVALGFAAQPILLRVLGEIIPFPLETTVDPATIARGIAMGLLTTLIAGLWPLLEVRAVPPSLILRREVDTTAWRPGRPWLVLAPILAGLAGLAIWQAGSLMVGAIFVGASTAALTLLAVIARGLVRLSRAVPALSWFAWRQGLASLHRPGGHAPSVIVALGVGVMLLVATALLETSLSRQIDHERRRETPSFFFVDLQPDQRETFLRTVSQASGGVTPVVTPVVRGRLAAIDGQPVTREMIDRRRDEGADRTWYLTREYVLTFAAEPPATNAITRGRWWSPADATGRPLISVEEEAARYLGVDIGGRLAFDVQGVRIEAEVLSLRKVDWQTLSTNFFVIFSPGVLEGAPLTYVATARVPASAEAAVQDAVVRALPNVIAVPVRDILERVATVLAHIAVAIRVIALFSIGAGLVVMTGTLAASRYQRLHESVILRTLGATRQAVARAFAVEYACLGIAAGLGGALLAALLTWIVQTFVLEIPWTLEPLMLLLGVAVTTAISIAVGFGATYGLLGKKPLPVLRQE